MKVTVMGIIQSLKNIGLWLGTYSMLDIKAQPDKFLYALLIYILVTVPTDLYLLNKAEEKGAEAETEET